MSGDFCIVNTRILNNLLFSGLIYTFLSVSLAVTVLIGESLSYAAGVLFLKTCHIVAVLSRNQSQLRPIHSFDLLLHALVEKYNRIFPKLFAIKGELSANGDAWNTCHFSKTGLLLEKCSGLGLTEHKIIKWSLSIAHSVFRIENKCRLRTG